MQNKKITILMICYNQEGIIGKTLDSILKQKNWGLYEIVIGDDCSTDNTVKVIRDYQNQYPNIIRLVSHDHNVGIYKNMESVVANRGMADLYMDCAGDDPIIEGFFEAVQEFLSEHNIDTDEAVGIYSDWKTISPEGKEKIHYQKDILTNNKPWSLYIHGKVCGRSLLRSEKVISQYEPIILDRGLSLAECMYDSQAHLYIDKAYYLPMVTSIYYSGIGVSTKLANTDYFTTQTRIKLEFLLNHYAKTQKDIDFLKYGLLKCDFIQKPSLTRFFKMFYYYEKGQLSECRDSIKYTVLLFGSMFKRHLLGKNN